MATRMEEVQAELRQSRLALSNAHAEIERLGVFSTQLKKVCWAVIMFWVPQVKLAVHAATMCRVNGVQINVVF